jgi:hypothetical protein
MKLFKRLKEPNQEVHQTFIDEYKNSGNFNKKQIIMLEVAYEEGLSADKVKIIANPKFNSTKMLSMIIDFVIDNASIDEIKKIYNL